MKKKQLIIISIIILVIVGVFISFKLFLDFNNETKIKNEINEIKRVAEANNDDIHEILDRRVVKSGPYSEVEVGIKLYYKNLYSSLDNLNFLLDDDNFSNYLSSKNLNDDKPSFIKSKNNLKNSKAQIEEYYSKFTDELTNDSIKLNIISDKELKNYYLNFYLDLTKIGIADNVNETIEKAYKSTLEKIDIYNETFDFLAANKGHWEIQNEAIAFDDPVIYDEYINITNKLNSSKESEPEVKEVSEN